MTTPASALPHGATRLHDWGVIRAAGAEAAKFLHGQLTQDIENLRDDQARLAGYCSAKGRLLATFVVWRHGSDEVLLACSADVLPAVLKRLTMFVLRAKCKLSDASVDVPLWGLAGELQSDAPVWGRFQLEGSDALRLPNGQVDGLPVKRWLCASSQALGTPGAPGAPDAPLLDHSTWLGLEASSAVPRVMAATSEQFVPQMVNLEAVGGVNFQKGCYPGQEIVARSQYRGTIKRRAQVVRSDTLLQPGQEVFVSTDPEQPAGQVVLAGSLPGSGGGSGNIALVEIKLAALGAGSLHAVAPGGPVLTLQALPYALPTEVD